MRHNYYGLCWFWAELGRMKSKDKLKPDKIAWMSKNKVLNIYKNQIVFVLWLNNDLKTCKNWVFSHSEMLDNLFCLQYSAKIE